MARSHILLVEDEDIIAAIITEILDSQNIHATVVTDGETAWSMLRRGGHRFETILLDRELPGMGGMDLLKLLKSTPQVSQIPVVLETSASDADSIQEGLGSGAYYYLTKPFQPNVLLAIVNSAVTHYRELRKMQEDVEKVERTLLFFESGRFRFRTLAEAQILASGLAKACPEPRKVILGLQELLINAVEHGNLGITYQEKTELIFADTLLKECERRLVLPENRDKTVEVVFDRRPDALIFTIRDQGHGFEWEKYMDFDPERIFDPNGRGIALACKQSFDSVTYLGEGNTVVAIVKLP